MQHQSRRQFIQNAAAVTLAACGAGCGGGKGPSSTLTLAMYVERLRTIPGGTFEMGGESLLVSAMPVHTVMLSAYRIGETPVTVSMWREYCTSVGKQMPEPPTWGWQDHHPIVGPSWVDIAGDDGVGGYCKWASAMTGISLFLPTEAQWEYAARGASQGTLFPWGEQFDPNKVWCSIKSGWDAYGTAAIDRSNRIYITNQGVKDLVGNTWEWCSDWNGDYAESHVTDPKGPETGKWKQVRGGCWADNLETYFQVQQRQVMPPAYNSQTIGFRLAAAAK